MTSTLDAELSLRMYRAAQRLQGVFTDEDRGMDGWMEEKLAHFHQNFFFNSKIIIIFINFKNILFS